MKSIVVGIAVFFAGVLTVSAQAQFNPAQVETITLKTKDDYARYEATMIAAAKWLESTPLNKEAEGREILNRFVFQYLAGSPTVNITLTGAVGDVVGKNAVLLPLYAASYARYSLEHKSTCTPRAAAKAGLESVITVYNNGVGVSRNKKLEKVIKMTGAEREQYIDKLVTD